MKNAKAQKMADFDPDGVGADNGHIFGLPFSYDDASICLLPVPWDVTASYGKGTAHGPQHILEASPQIDFYDRQFPDAWKAGVWMAPVDENWLDYNTQKQADGKKLVDALEGRDTTVDVEALRATIDQSAAQLLSHYEAICEEWLDDGKHVGLIGGEHSTSIALLKALAKRHADFGILQIDAHADLREAYMGLKHSHASIMARALELPQVTRLVQVGVRDLCFEEVSRAQADTRVALYLDEDIKAQQYEGTTFGTICDEIIAKLPQDVYVSFDIDGLHPSLCPGTGTPVPGGLQFEEAVYLLRKVVKSGRRIIGFDLVEVAPSEGDWDGNVGARLLYKMCLCAIASKQN